METTQDFVIGRDIVLSELEPLKDILSCLPYKAQYGTKNLMGHVWDRTKGHGVKNLFNALKERAHDNFKSFTIEYTCLDVSFDAIVLGTNLGAIFLYDRTCKRLSKLPSEVTHEPAKCVRLLPAHSYAAVGFNSGLITIFTFVLASQGFGKLQTMHVSGAHNSRVTCLEWSPDGELLYSGDVQGKVYVTVVKLHEELTQTAMILQEASPIVQLSYSWDALLISSEKRTVLWDFHSEKVTQVGQKERKSPGRFGAMFYPPVRGTSDERLKKQPTVYTSRPGQRLWTADTNGKVLSTLMYKGLTNENPPGIMILNPLPPTLTKLPPDYQPQFGPLRLLHGQFFVTWDTSRLWVLDPSPCALVGYHGNLGDIVDVSTAGHEIYVLQRGGERRLMKLSLIPRLANPLVDVVALMEHSYKSEEEENTKQPQLERNKQLPVVNNDKISEPVSVGTSDPSEKSSSLAVDHVDPFKRYQDIRHQDFGEIVFRKQKRNKKKSNKDSSSKTVSDTEDGIRDQLTTADITQPPDRKDGDDPSDCPDGLDPTLNRLSNISSDFDSGDRSSETSSGQNQESEGDDKLASTQPQLTIVHVTQQGSQEKHDVTDVSCASCVSHPASYSVVDDVTTQDNCVTEEAGKVVPLERTDDLNKSPSSGSVSGSTLSRENSLGMDSVSLSTSTLIEDDIGAEPVTSALDESSNADYLPNIYSNTPVNISDATFDASVEKSSRSKSRLVSARVSILSSIPRRASTDILSDSEVTPPVSLDSEGAEELGDTASWPRSPTRSLRAMSDLEIVNHEDVPPLEGSFSSTGSGSSLSRSPGSTSLNLRLLADSWADYSPPGPGYVQFVAVSNVHIWCVTTYDNIYYCPTHFSVVTWTQLRGSARMIAVNNAGDVIWCIDRKNYALVRKGVNANHLTGTKWQPVEKDMRYVLVDQSAVWGIKLNGDVFMRTDVSKEQPTGKGWRTILTDSKFVQASCFNGLAWFVDQANCIHVYKGVDMVRPAEKTNWEMLPGITAKWICLGIEGVAWIVDMKGSLWFTNVTHENPTGNSWYQVSLGQYLMQNRSLLEVLWSWVLRGDDVKLLTASPKAGVWLLGSGNSIQSSRGHLLGTRWDAVTPQGIAQSVFWTYLSAGSYRGDAGHVWALQPNGELMCFQPGARPLIVEPPQGKVLKLISASCNNLWGITHNFKVVQRTGISETCPQGFGWVELGLQQFGVGKVFHLSCGSLSTWAVDDMGSVWLRIGKEDSSDPSVTQAWIPVDGSPLPGCRFAKVEVSPADRVVWAVDDRNNVYARHNVTPSYPIGTSWEVVPGTGVRDLAISQYMVWATCPNGDIVCRYGVSEDNCLGHYWKKVPGNFELISVTPGDEVWAIDQNGKLFQRKTQHFYGTQSPFKPRTYSALFSGEEDWEFI